jgi:1,4-alpha-glucan branching enzyme
MIIYELHVGTYVGKNDGQQYPGNFKKLLTKLDYIKGLGANMIEILPAHEVPGPDAPNPTPYLGYSPTGLFAVESSYSSFNKFLHDQRAGERSLQRPVSSWTWSITISAHNGRDNLELRW